jgi:hypothetical protein
VSEDDDDFAQADRAQEFGGGSADAELPYFGAQTCGTRANIGSRDPEVIRWISGPAMQGYGCPPVVSKHNVS